MALPRPHDHLHVLRIDLSPADAREMLAERDPVRASLTGPEVDLDRVELVDPADLAGIGLSGYLIEGQGADPEAVRAEAATLDAVRDPVLILLPHAFAEPVETLYPKAPLSNLGRFPLVAPNTSEGPLRPPSADAPAADTPPPRAEDPASSRRAGGYVAMVALAVALFVAFVVWLVAA
ncbi:hypothetical protein LX81_00012 [Palleronia aestuarii]|uniref:Uncharacterized protein n=1 Tax=Palleronia aestuarii TaxID=568105 RepID=A0A2W7P2A1_9RHOB|nr:hypothetical protein [Palleronia aestuarii]PZX19556.1 hypothetical protein LX81_00012 [Palleronia aestuarii]